MKKTITAIIFFTLSLCLTSFSFASGKTSLEELERRANQGDVKAQIDLGYNYSQGFGGAEQNSQKSFDWYMKAAQQGDAHGQFMVAQEYLDMFDLTGSHINKALEWLHKAAEQDHTLAMFYLARNAEFDKDYYTAAKWYAKAANLGLEMAQFELGNMYIEGKGVRQNFDKAFDLFAQAANKKHDRAMYQMAKLVEEGKVTRQEHPLAQELYGKACDLGQQEACDAYKRLNTLSFAFSKADLQALESRASQGDMQAQSDLGYRYYMGEGVKKDGNKALQWLLKAAEQGNAQAMDSAAAIYYEKENYTAAAHWFAKAAALDHRAAQYQLGKMYFDGTGVKQNFDKALDLLSQSASLLYIPAIVALGVYFEDHKEMAPAKEFYQIACDLGSLETLNAQETIGMQEACEHYNRLDSTR